MPKALVDGWLTQAIDALRESCDSVTVVVGAQADDVRRLVPEGVAVLDAPDWRLGMDRSLAAGLTALGAQGGTACLVHLVDLPDVGPAVATRVASLAAPGVLARAVFQGRPGHPVLLGSDHWGEIVSSLESESGARRYLRRHMVHEVECGDLATGRDIDHRQE
jgi:CTP:molybdopterin cytidylyltransferase MocA